MGEQHPRAILLTGAAGNLGQELTRHLVAQLRAGQVDRLRLADIRPMAPIAGVEIVTGSLGDRDLAFSLAEGMDAIIHLAGIAVESTWDALIPANISGSAHLWDAAVAHGVDRILFASSNHAVGMYPTDQRIDHQTPPYPDSRYGLTKAFGEMLGRLYAEKTPVRAYCMRIGSAFAQATARRHLQTFQSHADFIRLVDAGLRADYRFEIVYGVSDNADSFWDNANARRLGYVAQDSAADFMAEVVDETDYRFQGGAFAQAALDPD